MNKEKSALTAGATLIGAMLGAVAGGTIGAVAGGTVGYIISDPVAKRFVVRDKHESR